MKKMIAFILATISILCCFSGCTTPNPDSDLSYIQEKGTLVVGITEYAPMDYKDENGNWTGFDAEFATLFAQELGVAVEFYVIADWSKKFMELDTKQIDVVWNGMTITDEATSNSSVSDPYVINAQVVVMKADAAENVRYCRYKTVDGHSRCKEALRHKRRNKRNRDMIAGHGVKNDKRKNN